MHVFMKVVSKVTKCYRISMILYFSCTLITEVELLSGVLELCLQTTQNALRKKYLFRPSLIGV